MKPLTRIDDNFSSSPQIDVDDLAEIKAAGFKSVICNRPDDEDGGAHDDHALLESTAKTLGLEFFLFAGCARADDRRPRIPIQDRYGNTARAGSRLLPSGDAGQNASSESTH